MFPSLITEPGGYRLSPSCGTALRQAHMLPLSSVFLYRDTYCLGACSTYAVSRPSPSPRTRCPHPPSPWSSKLGPGLDTSSERCIDHTVSLGRAVGFRLTGGRYAAYDISKRPDIRAGQRPRVCLPSIRRAVWPDTEPSGSVASEDGEASSGETRCRHPPRTFRIQLLLPRACLHIELVIVPGKGQLECPTAEPVVPD